MQNEITTLAQTTDTQLADIHERSMKARNYLAGAWDSLRYTADRFTGRDAWERHRNPLSTSEIDEILAANQDKLRPYDVQNIADNRERIAEFQNELQALRDEAAPLEALFNKHQWSRFFLVTSSPNGHIHKDMYCSSCTDTTTYGWLPQLSGLTEADAVADQGTRLCSVCFPTAPVEWTVGIKKEDPDKCPGSGTLDHDGSNIGHRPDGTTYLLRHTKCNHCHKPVTLTPKGKVRKHKVTK